MRRPGVSPFTPLEGGAFFERRNKMETKIPRDMAENDFQRFADFARLDLDSYRTEAQAEKVNACREHFIEGVMSGRVVVDDEGAVEVRTQSDDGIVVHFSRRPRQSDRKAMDRCKLTAIEQKEDAWLASLCGIPVQTLNRLEQADMRLVKEVFHLFLDE